MRRRRWTGLEIIAVLVAVLLLVLALFMIVGAIVCSASPSIRAEEGVTTSQAWTASLVASVLASRYVHLVLGHLDKRRRR